MKADINKTTPQKHPFQTWFEVLKKSLKQLAAGELIKIEINVKATTQDGRQREVTHVIDSPSNSTRVTPSYTKPVPHRPETESLHADLRRRFDEVKPHISTFEEFLTEVRQRLQAVGSAQNLFDGLLVPHASLYGQERSHHGLVMAAGFLIEADNCPREQDVSPKLTLAQRALEMNDKAVVALIKRRAANRPNVVAGGKARHAFEAEVHAYAALCLVNRKPNGGWDTKVAACEAIVGDVAQFIIERQIKLTDSNLEANLLNWMRRKDNPACIAFNKTKAS